MTTPKIPFLLTPGPLTTARATREAMLRDWGSRDGAFIALNRGIRDRLIKLAGGEGSHVCVPLQGSGTFAVEAMLGSFVPRDGKLLIVINGAYGHRMARMCRAMGRDFATYETAEDTPPEPSRVDALLAGDKAITHVAVVHCETTSGILNPLAEIAAVVALRGRRLLVDSMSGFGALPVDARAIRFDALAASANKCLEGVPGMAFVIARSEALDHCAGNAPTLSFDLLDQFQAMEKTAQWRFTPPTHVIAALGAALDAHEAEGGVAGRGARYRANRKILVDGMRKFGFETLLPDALQAPIIVTFHMPADPRFRFETFYDGLRDKGYVIYPGKLTVADSFRIGCIGQLHEAEMKGALAAVAATLAEMGVTQCGRAKAA
jgi:2-aminoethylphosphonate-pyruvate transaminase